MLGLASANRTALTPVCAFTGSAPFQCRLYGRLFFQNKAIYGHKDSQLNKPENDRRNAEIRL